MNIAIIGAGATGLSAAFDLLKAGHNVTIYEASDKPGGLAMGFKQPHWDWTVEKFYHHWFASDADLLGLADDLGIRNKVIYKNPTTVSYWNNGFYPLDSPLALLKFPGLPFLARLQLGAAIAYLKFLVSDGLSLENQSTHDWAQRWMGHDAYRIVFEPLMQGKFGDAFYKQVNMSWLWARLKSRTASLGTFEGGFQAFFDALAGKITELGGEIRYGTRVERVERRAKGEEREAWSVTTSPLLAPRPSLFDKILVTTSPRLMSQLAPALPPEYLGALTDLKSIGAIVLVAALDRPLSPHGYYWHSLPKNEGFPYLAMCEHTNFVDAAHFGGDRIIYCGDYLPVSHPTFSLSDAEIGELYFAQLPRFNPQFKRDWVKQFWVFREAYAQPVPLLNHSRHIPPTRTPLPGLFFASMSQVYPWDRGTNYAVQIGRKVAREMSD